jgi:hypothetical protein
MKKQKPETAPKNPTMILAYFKRQHQPLAAMWNGGDEKWVAAVPQIEPVGGEWIDTYFQSEQFSNHDLEWWVEI